MMLRMRFDGIGDFRDLQLEERWNNREQQLSIAGSS